jgi:hypothetical protein
MRARGSLPRSLQPSCSLRRSDRRARDPMGRLANGAMRASSRRRRRRIRSRRMPATRGCVPSADRHRISRFRSSTRANRPRSHQFRPTRRPRRARTESRPLPSADTTQQRLPCPDVGRSPRASARPPSHSFTHEAIALHTRRRLATGDLLCRTFSLPQRRSSRRPK